MKINHVFKGRKGKYICCENCSHVPLHNQISELVTRLGCEYLDCKEYKDWIAKGKPAKW